MARITDALADYRIFSGIIESWELVRTGFINVNGVFYRLELLHSFSNLDTPFGVLVYTAESGVWRRLDLAIMTGLDADTAMRSAMEYVVTKAAA